MKNKIAILVLSTMLFALCLPAQAQQPAKVPRIGVLMSSSTAETQPFIDAFRQGLRELGYVEGKNIVLDIRGGEAKPERLSSLADELVGLKVDIIVAGGGRGQCSPCR
jgi:putative ABC transport system substrate-binding protein